MKRKNMELIIRNSMKKQKTYSKAMDVAIEQAAIPLSKCVKLADELENVNGVFDNRDGNDTNVQKEYLTMKWSGLSLKWMQAMRLTPDTIEAEIEEDAMDKLTKKMNK